MFNDVSRFEQNQTACRPSAARRYQCPPIFVFPDTAVKTTPETPVLSPPPPSPVGPLTPYQSQPAAPRPEPTAVASAQETQLDTTHVAGHRRVAGPSKVRAHTHRPAPPVQVEHSRPDRGRQANIPPTATLTRNFQPDSDPRKYENVIPTSNPGPETDQANQRLTRYPAAHIYVNDAVDSEQPDSVMREQYDTYGEYTQNDETWGTFDETTDSINQPQPLQDASYGTEWQSPNIKPTSLGVIPPLPSLRTRKSNVPSALHIPDASHAQPRSPVQRGLGAGAAAGLSLPYDIYIGSQNVFGLTEDTFQTYVTNNDLAVVMFYDPVDPNSLVPKGHFRKFADTKKHGSHHFAGVNCQREPDFCASLDGHTLPMFTFYSWGKLLGTIRETSHFDDKAMGQYLDKLGDMGEAGKASKKRCLHLLPEIKHAKCALAKKLGFKK